MVFSVTSDISASASHQTTAPKSARPDSSQASDSFAALVDAVIPADPATSAPSSSSPSSTQQQEPSQRSSSSNASASNSDSSRSHSTASSNSGSANDSSATNAASSDATAQSDGKSKTKSDGKSDTKSDTASSTANSSDSQPTDKPSGDKTAKDDTTAAKAVDPNAALVPVLIQPNVVATPASAPTTATDATGSAVSAAAASAANVQAGASVDSPGTADTAAGLMAAAAKTTDGAAKAATDQAATIAATVASDKQAGATGDAASNDKAFATVLDAAVPGSAKPGSITAPTKSPTKSGAAATAAAVDQSANAAPPAEAGRSNATSEHPPQGQGLQGAQDAADANVVSASPAHDHASTTISGAAHAPTIDLSAQAATALQPQLLAQVAASPVASTHLTATAAAGAAVPLSGIAVEIAVSALNGKSRFELRLDPAELGRIDVRIDVDRSGQVTSHLRVEKPETLAMLQQSAPQLQQALQDAGLKTGSGGLQFSLRDQSSSGQNGNDNQSNSNAQRLIVTEEDIVPATLAGRSYGRTLGTQGGIDIRV